MNPLSASKTASQRRKRNTPPKRNRAGGAINSRKPSESKGLRRNGRRCCRTFAFAAKDRIQFAAKKQQQTSQIHPGEQNDDGGECEISRVITIVPCDVELKEFRHRNPADRKKYRSRQCLTH